MAQRRPLPIHKRITLDEFLAFTGWEMNPGASRTAMTTALDFYQDCIPRPILMQKVARPSPWSLPRGDVIKLSELMQAIDFRGPVERLVAQCNRRFKCFRPRNEPKAQRPRGNWFTDPSARQESLALPGEQDLVRVYVVQTPAQCLKSRVSDAFTWIRRNMEQIEQETLSEKYFHGSGFEYFIWEPQRYLTLA